MGRARIPALDPGREVTVGEDQQTVLASGRIGLDAVHPGRRRGDPGERGQDRADEQQQTGSAHEGRRYIAPPPLPNSGTGPSSGSL